MMMMMMMVVVVVVVVSQLVSNSATLILSTSCKSRYACQAVRKHSPAPLCWICVKILNVAPERHNLGPVQLVRKHRAKKWLPVHFIVNSFMPVAELALCFQTGQLDELNALQRAGSGTWLSHREIISGSSKNNEKKNAIMSVCPTLDSQCSVFYMVLVIVILALVLFGPDLGLVSDIVVWEACHGGCGAASCNSYKWWCPVSWSTIWSFLDLSTPVFLVLWNSSIAATGWAITVLLFLHEYIMLIKLCKKYYRLMSMWSTFTILFMPHRWPVIDE